MGIPKLLSYMVKHFMAKDFDMKAYYEGKTIGIDMSFWLYGGGRNCARELVNRLDDNDIFIKFCTDKLAKLKAWGIEPYAVFDGDDDLPIKAEENSNRIKIRLNRIQKAREHDERMETDRANEAYKKGLKITHMMSHRLIERLQQEKIKYVVAPYEADAQLAYMFKTKVIHAVIANDVDMIPFGCGEILYDVNYESGTCNRFVCNWPKSMDEPAEFPKWAEASESAETSENSDQKKKKKKKKSPKNPITFEGFSLNMFIEACVLMGCDYCNPPLLNMGIENAHNYLKEHRSAKEVFGHLIKKGNEVTQDYKDRFERAVSAFKYHIVYDIRTLERCRLTEYPLGDNAFPFLGQLTDSMATFIARGLMHPTCRIFYSDKEALEKKLAEIEKRQLEVYSLK